MAIALTLTQTLGEGVLTALDLKIFQYAKILDMATGVIRVVRGEDIVFLGATEKFLGKGKVEVSSGTSKPKKTQSAEWAVISEEATADNMIREAPIAEVRQARSGIHFCQRRNSSTPCWRRPEF